MRIGIFAGDVTGAKSLARLVDEAVAAEVDGFSSYWLPWVVGHDPMIALALAAGRTTTIELGTGVMRTYPRHPADLAPAALTLGAASGGRFTLGIGASHRPLVEGMFGYRFDRPVQSTEEYLTIITGLLAGELVHHEGRHWTARLQLARPDPVGVPVVLAALGSKMLEVAGRLAAGTFTWMTGPVTLAEHTVPTITAAAAAAGRPPPRIIAGAPVVVTSDPDSARQRAAKVFAGYGLMPSYQAMLDREGWTEPADAAIVGDEDEVSAQLHRLHEAGVTDFAAVEYDDDPDVRARTRSTLAAFRAM